MNCYVCLAVCLDNYDSNQARTSVKHRWQLARHKASFRKTFMCLGMSVSVLIWQCLMLFSMNFCVWLAMCLATYDCDQAKAFCLCSQWRSLRSLVRASLCSRFDFYLMISRHHSSWTWVRSGGWQYFTAVFYQRVCQVSSGSNLESKSWSWHPDRHTDRFVDFLYRLFEIVLWLKSTVVHWYSTH